ncbi:FimV/HubP family polar landmark protein [Acidithiobacillus sp.]|uniref:FimV/HubP family polar landmark protein n=1 Tax=Acidithiobacillus sp. TaxID=1872118 RepID=UPI003D010C72
MDKKWLRTLLGVGILLPGVAQAVGLGELQVLSAPGEPFRAEIPIRSLTPQEAGDVRVSLASSSAFAMIHLPVAQGLEHWHFQIRTDQHPAVLITSPVPLPTPSLSFLVQLDWSGGRIVREYTARSSLGSYLAAAPSGAETPSAQGAPAYAAPASRPAAAAPLVYGWAGVRRYGPVRNNQSLFQIAQSITRSNAVTLDQVMAALIKANPAAFKNGNPSYLYAGSILRVPTLGQVQGMAPAQATAFLAGQRATPAVQPTAAAPAGQAGPATHLVLSSAPATAVLAPTASAGSAAADLLGQLQQRTAALVKENGALAAQVQSLGNRLAAEERLIASQGAQLGALAKEQGATTNPLHNPLLWASLGGNVLLLLLFLWLYGRQKQNEKRQREISQKIMTMASAPSPAVALAPAPKPTPIPVAVAPAASIAAAPAVAPPALMPTPVEKPVEEIVDVDPVEQADMYLTYGKAEQAAAVLSEALEDAPRRKDLYVKLLDVYAGMDRRDDYLELAERMRGRFGPHNSAWQEVAAQGAQLFPGNALFAAPEEAAAAPGGAAVPAEATIAAAVPEVVPAPFQGEAAEHPAAAPESVPLAADVLEFDLGAAFGEKPAETTSPPVEEAAAEEEALRFSEVEKERLLRSIDEQFRALDEAPARSAGLALAAEPAAVSAPAGAEGEEIVGAASALDWDAVGTKLDLAKAYLEMGDGESARELLEEVVKEGGSEQQGEARQLLAAL